MEAFQPEKVDERNAKEHGEAAWFCTPYNALYYDTVKLCTSQAENTNEQTVKQVGRIK